jgi:hypothetical protein
MSTINRSVAWRIVERRKKHTSIFLFLFLLIILIVKEMEMKRLCKVRGSNNGEHKRGISHYT